MADAGAIRAGKAFVEIGTDQGPLYKGLAAAGARIKAWGRTLTGIGASLAGLGATLTAPFVQSLRVFKNSGDALDEMAQRTGVSVEALSRFAFAAGRSGAELSDVELALKMMGKSGDFAGQQVEQAFIGVLDKIAATSDPFERTRLAVESFGKAGASLIPLALEYRNLALTAERLNLVMSQSDASAAAALADAWDDVVATLNALQFAVGAALVGDIQELAETVRDTLAASIRWVRENQQLVRVAAAAGLALIAAGAATVALGVGLIGLVAVGSSVVAALAAVKSMLLFLVSPLGLVLLALRGAFTYWMLFTEQGRNATSRFVQVVSDLLSHLGSRAASTWEGMSQALAGGDLALAAQIAWSSVQLTTLEALDALVSHTREGIVRLVGVFADLESVGQSFVALYATFLDAQNAAFAILVPQAGMATDLMQSLWSSFASETESAGWDLRGSWFDITDGIAQLWADAMAFITNATLDMSKGVADAFDALKPFLDPTGLVLGSETTYSDDDYAADRRRAADEYRREKETLDDMAAARRKERESHRTTRETQARGLLDRVATFTDSTSARDTFDTLRQRAVDLPARSAASLERVARDFSLPDETGVVRTRSTTLGTFSAAAAAGLGVSGEKLEIIAQATRQTAKNTDPRQHRSTGIPVV